MQPNTIIILFVALMAITGIPAFICVLISNQTAKKRKEQIFDLATDQGFLFNPGPCEAHIPLSGFIPFDQGRNERSYNHLQGKLDEIEWDIFDYKYVTGYGKRKVTNQWSVVAARVDFMLPPILIRPPGLMDKVAGLVGVDEITFASDEFNSRYKVQCDDYQACRELIHPKMIQHLLNGESRTWQIRGTRIVITQMGHSSIEQTKNDMELIRGFVRLIPASLREARIDVAGSVAHS